MSPFTRYPPPSATLRRPRDPGHGADGEPRRSGERCSPLVSWPLSGRRG
ncbi:hypothetical protein F750_2929 [Streptomyces sp. PAMC 26508]|nr:hypothetical protein F750_2929 [Streptomyces sp. PAMC 26508]